MKVFSPPEKFEGIQILKQIKMMSALFAFVVGKLNKKHKHLSNLCHSRNILPLVYLAVPGEIYLNYGSTLIFYHFNLQVRLI